MFNWSKYPLLRILGSYLSGTLLFFTFRYFFHIPILFGLIISIFGILLIFLSHYYIRYKYRIISGSIIIVSFVWIGFFGTYLYVTTNKAPLNISKSNQKILYIGDVKESPMIKTNSVKLIVRIVQYKDSNQWQTSDFDIILFVKKDERAEKIKYGDRLIFYTQAQCIDEPKNPQEFNYKRYLEIKNIHLQGFVSLDGWETVAEKKGNKIMIFASQIRQKLVETLNKGKLDKEENAVISAILLGSDDKLDADLAKRYASAGVSHILCVSGMHVGIIFIIINYVLFFLSKNKKQKIIKTVILLFSVWLYACITGMSPSVMRASTMFTFVAFGNMFERNVNTYNSLLSSFFFLSCINPLIVFEVGMQLSYAAVLGIVWLQKPVKNLYHPKTKVGNYIFEIMAVSLVAQLLTFPLSMYYFHQFPNYFLLANIAIISFTPFVVGIGILCLSLSFWEFTYNYLSIVLNYMIKCMNYIVSFIESLPFSTLQNIYMNPWQMGLCYICVLFLASSLLYKKKKHLFVSIISVLSILFISLHQEMINHNKKEIVFYSIPHGFVMDCIDGKTAYVVGDSISLKDSLKINFHIQNYRIKRGINKLIIEEKYKNSNFYKSGNFIYYQGKYIFIVNNTLFYENQTPEKLNIDYLLIDANPRIKIKNIIKMITPETIIFSRNNPRYKINKWQEECDSLGLTYYTLSDKSLQIEL
ncbi:MAG: ComEC/Rec2 family competence protein [Bacteroidales bacterium]|jgi:competence protein ComEC|nr:ComEC/Rec2 family competence protein [Bacteroidales bacterium]